METVHRQGRKRIWDFGFGTSGRCAADAARIIYGECAQTGRNNGVRDAGSGVREGVDADASTNIYGDFA